MLGKARLPSLEIGDMIFPKTIPKLNVEALTPDERLSLIERLWNSLEEAEVPLTSAQQADLAQRIADIDKHPHDQLSWEEAQRQIWGRPR